MGYEWASSHIAGRKAMATEMDRKGKTARQTADQLGHANITTTQKHYFGRERIVTVGADVMECLVEAAGAGRVVRAWEE